MDSIIERINYLMSLEGIDLRTMSDIFGMPYANIRRQLNGDVKIQLEMFVNISNHYPLWNMNWILKGEGEAKLEIQNSSNDLYKNIEPIIYGEDSDDTIWLETYKITGKAALGLVSSFFDEDYFNNLEKGKIKVNKKHNGLYFEVDTFGDSMNDGLSHSILDKDRVLVKNIARKYWQNKLPFEKWDAFYFLHNERGALIKHVINHDIETGQVFLNSWNTDRDEYPDFSINIRDCYIIGNVVKLISRDYNFF